MNFGDTWFHAKRHVAEFFEDQWFDRTHHVHTSGDVSLWAAGIQSCDQADSELYVPARPAHIREALGAAMIRDPGSYTFIDIGSGKGRTLFVAAELPFCSIVGVEFSAELHDAACRNVQSFSFRGQSGERVHPLHGNAKEYVFPRGPLVVYLFNPFGAATMSEVLRHLQASLDAEPRHVVVILLWPRCGDQVLRVPGMQMVCETQRHAIYEAHPPLR